MFQHQAEVTKKAHASAKKMYGNISGWTFLVVLKLQRPGRPQVLFVEESLRHLKPRKNNVMLLYLTASIFIHVWVSIILSHTRDRGCTNLLEQHKPCIAMAWFNIMYLMIETTGVACISHNYSCQTHTFLHRLPSQVFTQNLSKCITWNPESIEEDENRTTSNFLPKTRATGF